MKIVTSFNRSKVQTLSSVQHLHTSKGNLSKWFGMIAQNDINLMQDTRTWSELSDFRRKCDGSTNHGLTNYHFRSVTHPGILGSLVGSIVIRLSVLTFKVTA